MITTENTTSGDYILVLTHGAHPGPYTGGASWSLHMGHILVLTQGVHPGPYTGGTS